MNHPVDVPSFHFLPLSLSIFRVRWCIAAFHAVEMLSGLGAPHEKESSSSATAVIGRFSCMGIFDLYCYGSDTLRAVRGFYLASRPALLLDMM